jgi:hypothetical protein
MTTAENSIGIRTTAIPAQTSFVRNFILDPLLKNF